MNRLSAVIVVVTMLAGVATGARAHQAETPGASRDLIDWFHAVDAHTPGLNDPALETIKSLSPGTFLEIRRALGDRRKAQSVESFNRLVHRGAVMHLDAAMALVGEGKPGPYRRPGSSRFRSTAVLTSDGGFNGVEVMGLHWEYGRALIDYTLPLPSEDETARRWYVAAAAFMVNRALLADLTPHLERARKLFPSDPDVLFLSGCYFEAVSSPRVLPLYESPDLPSGIRIAAPSARESWRQAEHYFRRAAEARPGFAAARVRRARSLHLLGRNDEALGELREAVTRTDDPKLLYFAAIFEGAAQEALGDMTAASASYERAATLFPNAQAPYIALSRIARDRGDRAAAQTAMARGFARETRAETDDPWWTYHLWFVGNAGDLFTELRQPFMPGVSGAKK
jgi:hypothetical protein